MFGWLKKGKKQGTSTRQTMVKVPDDHTYVVFVCTANLSRSPMAESMMRREIEGHDGYVIDSAGTKSTPGFAPTPEALTVLQMQGYDTEGLKTARATKEMLARADYVFVMADGHLRSLSGKFPDAADKIFMLSDLSEDPTKRGMDIPDPHEQPLTVYLEVYELLLDLIPRVATFIEDGPSEEWQEWYDFYRAGDQALGR